MEEDVQGDCEECESGASPSVTRLLTERLPQNDLSSHERALYGALAGELEAVLPVCESWDDHLWAHVSAKIERR